MTSVFLGLTTAEMQKRYIYIYEIKDTVTKETRKKNRLNSFWSFFCIFLQTAKLYPNSFYFIKTLRDFPDLFINPLVPGVQEKVTHRFV